MGSAVGQVPEYTQMITEWVKEKARTPVLVKLTPNISDIRTVARAARRVGADGLSAINTINSITGIDLDTFVPRPNVDGKSSHGGYCGPAVKPIALNLVQQVMADPESALPLSGIGGISTWQRRGGVHAARLRNRIRYAPPSCITVYRRSSKTWRRVLENWMRTKGFATIEDFRGLLHQESHRVEAPESFNYKIVAHINEQTCQSSCDLCHIACWDGAHQCIHLDRVEGPVNVVPSSCMRLPLPSRSAAAPPSPPPRLRARSVLPLLPVMGLSPRRWRAFHVSMKPSASAAISARWSARLTTASR